MTLVDFISRVSPDEYFVSGAYHELARHTLALPAEGVGQFLRDNQALVFEGSYRHHRGTTSYPFSLKVPLTVADMGSAEIRSAHTGALIGHFLPAGEGFEMLAWSPSGNILACRMELDSNGLLRLSGSAKIGDSSIAFSVGGHAHSDRGSLENVVRISGGRRA